MTLEIKSRNFKEIKPIPVYKTIKESTNICGLKEYHLRRLVKNGKVVYIKTGKKVLVNVDSLIDYLNTGDETTKMHEVKQNIRKVGE